MIFIKKLLVWTALFYPIGMIYLLYLNRNDKRKLWDEYWASDGKHGDFENFCAWKEAQKDE